MELVCKSTYSVATQGELSEPFVVTLKDQCWDTVLTAPAFTQTSWTYDLWAAESLTFSAMADSLTTCGSYTYKLIDQTTGNEVDTSVFT